MLARIRKSMEERDQGFTLIELLVVMIIIGILAAIAIPVFLQQRENGYRAALESDLRNAAMAIESAAVSENGSYTWLAKGTELATGTVGTVDIEFTPSADVTVTVPDAGTSSDFCIQATHKNLAQTEVWSYTKAQGVPVEGACS